MHLFYHIICAAGLCLTFAFDDLSLKAETSQVSTFSGPQNLYEASYAVDRKTATCTRTEQIGPNSMFKIVWWKVDLGGTYNIYSIHILFKNYENYEYRQRGRLAGFSLYVSNTGNIQDASLCYKDGSQLPPLNFTTECTKSGRFVIFYNERLNGVTYPTGYELDNVFTELCEVIVKGCRQSGVYGTECDIPCPGGCKGNTCHIQSGACLKCEHGMYGKYCNLTCPTNCRYSTCHTQNGTCFTCKPGWTNVYCKTKCTERWYGINCSQQCTGHCRDGVTCNHVTGHCDGGCDAGWTGAACKQACIQSYGENCRYPCSPHCYNQTCDKFNGRCLLCCTDGFHGERCDREPVKLNQNKSGLNSRDIGLIVSLVINFVLISGACLLFRGIYTKNVSLSGDLFSCSKKSIYYTDTNVKTSEISTYQELNLSREEIQYQNTTIR